MLKLKLPSGQDEEKVYWLLKRGVMGIPTYLKVMSIDYNTHDVLCEIVETPAKPCLPTEETECAKLKAEIAQLKKEKETVNEIIANLLEQI